MTNAYEHDCQDDEARYLRPPLVYTRDSPLLVPANDDWRQDPLTVFDKVGLATGASIFAVLVGLFLASMAHSAEIIRAVM